MSRTRLLAWIVAGLWVGAVGCGDDDSLQGTRDVCANASGTLLGCDEPTIDTPEDACWRLVDCGAIPLEHVDDHVLDWATCVRQIESFSEPRYDYTLECIQTSSCDDLKVDGSPVDPSRWPRSVPLCLQYGDEPN